MPAPQDLDWLRDVPIRTSWDVQLDQVWLPAAGAQAGVLMHPFLAAQLRHPRDPIARLDEVRDLIIARVGAEAYAARRRLDDAIASYDWFDPDPDLLKELGL